METRESRGRKRTFEAHGNKEDSQGSHADSRPSRHAEQLVTFGFWSKGRLARLADIVETIKVRGAVRTLCSWSKGRLARLADIVETIKVIGLCETFEEKVERVDCIFRF